MTTDPNPILATTYSYTAFGGAGHIRRNGVSAESLAKHYANLIICGFAVRVKNDRTGKLLTRDEILDVQAAVLQATDA